MKNNIIVMIVTCLVIVVSTLTLANAAQGTLLADTHAKNDISCESCHGNIESEKALSDACIECHGDYDEVAKLTAKNEVTTDLYRVGHLYLENLNAHEQHLGDIPCFSCHTVHSQLQQEESPCYACHTFKLKMP